jgi:hypothetical protein
MKNIIVLCADLDANFYFMKIISSVKFLYPDCTVLKIKDMGALPFIIDEFRFIFNSNLKLNMDELELADIFIVIFGNTASFPKGLQFKKIINPLNGPERKISIGDPFVILTFVADSIWTFLGADPLVKDAIRPVRKIGKSSDIKLIGKPNRLESGEKSTMGRFWEILFTWAQRVDEYQEIPSN